MSHRVSPGGRGFIHLLTVFLLILMLIAVAAVMNTGAAVSAKIRAQTAADSAAYSSAAVMSRVTNAICGVNVNIVRTASAEALAWAVWPTVEQIMENWERAIASAGPFGGAVAARIAALEAPVLARFILRAGPTGAREMAGQSLVRRIERMHRWQVELARATPDLIEAQRARAESFYGVSITLSQLGSPHRRIHAPVRQPRGRAERFVTIAELISRRIDKDRAAWDRDLRRIRLGRGSQVWREQTSLMGIAVAARIEGKFMVLETHDGAVERKPTRSERNARFAVTAVTVLDRRPQRVLMPRIFAARMNRAADALAFAQAETYHMADDGRNPRPSWRLWSFAGWHWQPRLTFARALPGVLARDAEIARLFHEAGATTHDDLRLLLHH